MSGFCLDRKTAWKFVLSAVAIVVLAGAGLALWIWG